MLVCALAVVGVLAFETLLDAPAIVLSGLASFLLLLVEWMGRPPQPPDGKASSD
jgi:hypothetical protein